MIKEILLASLLSINNTQVYNLNNQYSKFTGYIHQLDNSNGLNTFAINLNTGDSIIGELSTFTDGPFTLLELDHIGQNYNEDGDLNISYFINYLYDYLIGEDSNPLFVSSYMEMVFEFDIFGLVLNDGIHNTNCYYTATLGSVAPHGPNTFYKVCDTYEGSNFYSNSNGDNQHILTAFEFQDFIGDAFTSDLYLILTFHNMYIPQGNQIEFGLNFSYDLLYFEIELPLNLRVSTSNIENRYTNFIYENYFNLQQENNDLNYEINQLEGENDILTQMNNELRNENDRLNSKFVFNNTFDLLSKAIESASSFLNLEIAPNLTIGMLVTIPIVVAVALFVLKGVSL